MSVQESKHYEFEVSGKGYEIIEHSGEIVEVTSLAENEERVFFKFDHEDVEEDYVLRGMVGVRKGHKVTFIYTVRDGENLGQIVGLINHTTGRSCYREEVGEHYFPNRGSEALFAGALGGMDSTNDLMAQRGPLMGLIMLPIFLILAAICLVFFLVGCLFWGSSAKKRQAIKTAVQNYMSVEHKIEWPVKKKGLWYFSWRTVAGCFGLLFVLSFF